jgi:hypothetical protein
MTSINSQDDFLFPTKMPLCKAPWHRISRFQSLYYYQLSPLDPIVPFCKQCLELPGVRNDYPIYNWTEQKLREYSIQEVMES